MKYNLETIELQNQIINLALPKNFSSTQEYNLYLVFDGNSMLTNSNLNILNKNTSNIIFVGLNNPNDAIRFDNLATFCNTHVKNAMEKYFPELKNTKRNYLGGKGQEYLNFIKNKLLPWIINDKKIKIANLNLLGCSMGAYFSLQLLYLSNLTFKKVYLFSPSIWFNEKILNDLQTKKLNNEKALTVNLWVGLKEPKLFEKTIATNYYQEALGIKAILKNHQQIKVNFFVDKTGSHGFKWWINFINNHQDLW
ncbi:MAG: alpha/beta hydrolase-fold protein [Spiroplasma sp.]